MHDARPANIQHASATPYKINFKTFPNANHFTNFTNKAKTKSITIKNFRQHKSPPTINDTTGHQSHNPIAQTQPFLTIFLLFFSFLFYFTSSHPATSQHVTIHNIHYAPFYNTNKEECPAISRNKQKIKQRTKFLYRQTHK